MPDADLIVIGAGVVGLAHAYHAHRAGRTVLVLERRSRPAGALVRHLGMVWPIGQSAGRNRETAIRARHHWITLAREAGFWLSECGSLHLAYRDDEAAVLGEYLDTVDPDDPLAPSWIDPKETLARSCDVNPRGLLGAMWSPSECAVNPPRAIRALGAWLGSRSGVELRFDTPVNHCTGGEVRTAHGELLTAEQIVVACGDDGRVLFPGHLAERPVRRCRAQMLATLTPPPGCRPGPHLVGGLTLRSDRSFEVCPSLPALRDRIAAERPDLAAFGIDVLVAPHESGELVIGASHEYGPEFDPWENLEIERLICDELSRFLLMPEWTIARRWPGYYARSKNDNAVIDTTPTPGVRIVTGLGGDGMTLALGVAERVIAELGLGVPVGV